MTAKIIKLDEYLNEYIDMNQPKIVVGITNALGVDEELAQELYSELTRQQEVDLVTSFMSDTLNDEQKIAVAHTMFDPILATMNQPQPFGGVDIAEGFNFRREISNEVARNNAMDWLEENSIEYLIDNMGNFAVKCADRKIHYRVNRQFEHILGKWDNGPVGKNVDPTVRHKALSVDMKGNVLSDALHEDDLTEAAQDGSMPLPDMSGTPPMFPAEGDGDMTDGASATFENTEDGAIQILGDHLGFSSEIYIEKLEEDGGEWLVCDDAAEASFVVDTKMGAFEEVRYICEHLNEMQNTSGSWKPAGGSSQSRAVHGKNHPDSAQDGGHAAAADRFNPDKHGAQGTFNSGGEYVDNDPVSNKHVSINNKIIAMQDDDRYDAAVNGDMEKRLALLTHYKIVPEPDSPFEANMYTTKKWDSIQQRYDVSFEEAKKKKPNAPKIRDPFQQHLKTKGHAIEPDKKKAASKSAARGKVVYEGVIGAATGMTGMQTLGMNRLRKLAEMPSSSMTIIEIEPSVIPVKNEPIVATGEELRDMDVALDHLDEVFNIYKTLNTMDKTHLRLNLINSIMDETQLSESVIGLLLDNKSSILLEFDGDGEQLTESDKEYAIMVIDDIKSAIMEDINRSEGSVVVSLARVAYLLEALQVQMDDEK